MSWSRRGRHLTAVLGVAAIALSALAAPAAAAGPPSALFRAGYDLCRAAPLAAVRKAGGQPYKRGILVNEACTWQRADLRASLVLSTHPSSTGSILMHDFLVQNGKKGLDAKRIAVRGASKAVLVTLHVPGSTGTSKILLAGYPRGVIQINMTAPALPDARLLAVVQLVARM